MFGFKISKSYTPSFKPDKPCCLLYERIKEKYENEISLSKYSYSLKMNMRTFNILAKFNSELVNWEMKIERLEYPTPIINGIMGSYFNGNDGSYILDMKLEIDNSINDGITFKKGEQIRFGLAEDPDNLPITLEQ